MQIEINRAPRRSAARSASITAGGTGPSVSSKPGTMTVSARRTVPRPWRATISNPVEVRTGPGRSAQIETR